MNRLYSWVSRRPKLAFWVTALSAAFIGIGIGGASAADQAPVETGAAAAAWTAEAEAGAASWPRSPASATSSRRR